MARAKQQELSIEEKLEQALVPEDEWPYEVPDNWCWTKIGTLSTLYRGVSYKKDDANNIQGDNDCLIMRGGNIKEGQIDLFAEDNVYVNKSMVSENQLVKKDDIIIVSSTGSIKVIGRAGISGADYLDVSFGAFLTLVRPIGSVCKKYVALYFQGDNYRNRIRELASGVNINNIRNEYITETSIPLPPLAEQQRIVDRIESLFAKLDQAKELAQNALDSFETRKAAILHEAFTGELTAKWREKNGLGVESWEEKSLKDICAKITDGEHFRPPVVDMGVPFLSAKDIRDEGVSFDDILYISQETADKALKRCNPQAGDILIVSRGATVGRMCIVNTDRVFCLLGSVILLKVQGIISKLLLCFLKSPSIHEKLKDISGATAQQAIYLRDIKDIKVPLPTLPEQQEIVQIIDHVFEKEQKAKELCDVIDKIDLMKKAILARAFRGELGTNDPSEESAVKLLKECLK